MTSKPGSLPSAHTQVDMAIIQGGIAYKVARDHASRGADPGEATQHGAHVGGAVLAWWLFVLVPSVFWTIGGFVIMSPIFWFWVLCLDLGAWFLHRVLTSWRHRDIGSPSPWGLHGGLLAGAWVCWLFAIFPIALLVAVLR